MAPFEVLTSESQERMLAIVTPDDLDEVLEICRRWEVTAAVIGTVTDGTALRILDGPGADANVLGEVPAASLHEDAPRYDRPRREPPANDALAGEDLPAPDDPGADLIGLLVDTSWVWSQYDHQLFLNTVEGPGGDATVLRLKHPDTGVDTGRGIALSSDGNHRWCALDPRSGTSMVVAESVANLAVAGARPLALVNCLNFGNPEHAEVMWQLSEAVDGMSDACNAFDVPVIGGNVSLYNESRGRDIDPTPVVATLGLIDDLSVRPPGVELREGGRLLLVGDGPVSLDGSSWAWERDAHGGSLPTLDLGVIAATLGVVRELVADGLALGAHDVSSGGVAVALAEMAVRSGVGFRVARMADHRELFGESVGRVVLCVAADRAREVLDRCEAHGVACVQLGAAMGERLQVKDLLDVGLADATQAWRERLPTALGAGTTQG
jgi:phosphoribosylformylglycinamidine synthase